MFSRPDILAKLKEIGETQADLSANDAHDFAFHMTDWLEDLEALLKLYNDPTAADSQQAAETLFALLVHVPNHLAAAGKIFTGESVSDVFGVGATDAGAA